MKNYYQLLGLESNASKDEIKKAFRLYAQHYHPDKQDGNKFFEQRFIEIKNAYDILVDDNKRYAYDLSQKINSSQDSKNNSFLNEKEIELRKKETELRNREMKLKKEEEERIKRETELRKKEAEIRQKENQIRYEQEIENEKIAWKKEQERLWEETKIKIEITNQSETKENIENANENNKKQETIQKETKVKEGQLKHKLTIKEASNKYVLGSTKFYCGICKNKFYSKRSKELKVICPNCKLVNTLPISKGLNTIIPMSRTLRNFIIISVAAWLLVLLILLIIWLSK